MARVKLASYEESSPELKEVYERMSPSRSPINIYKALGNSPESLWRLHHAVNYFRKTPALPKHIGELAILLTARILDCQYVYDRHARMALNFGATLEQVKAVGTGDESPFDEKEQAALSFIADFVKSGRASEETHAALHKHFDDQQIVELTVDAGLYILTCKFVTIMELENEPGFQPPF